MSTTSTPRTDRTTVLTRREARAIERQTGVRPVAGAAVAGVPTETVNATVAELATWRPPAPVAAWPGQHDTARIERNELGTVASVIPLRTRGEHATVESLPHEETLVPAAFSPRTVSIRAAKPAALVARGRRRTAASLAAAATVAAAATAGVVVPAAVADGQSGVQSEANLLAATTPEASTDAVPTETAAAAPEAEVALVAAPETAVDRTDSTVVTLSSDDLAAVAQTPTPTPTPEATAEAQESASTSESSSSGGSSSSQSTSSSSGSSSGSSGGGGGLNVDTSSLIAAAQSYVGAYFPLCTDLTKAVYATQGITLSGTVSNQVAGARQTSNPQPGDLVVQPGAHIGIYAGNGMVIDSPGYGGKVVQYRSIWWSNPVYYTFN